MRSNNTLSRHAYQLYDIEHTNSLIKLVVEYCNLIQKYGPCGKLHTLARWLVSQHFCPSAWVQMSMGECTIRKKKRKLSDKQIINRIPDLDINLNGIFESYCVSVMIIFKKVFRVHG